MNGNQTDREKRAEKLRKIEEQTRKRMEGVFKGGATNVPATPEPRKRFAAK